MMQCLGYVCIETTDLNAWRVFGTQVLGMMEVDLGLGADVLTLKMDDRPFRVMVTCGEQERFVAPGFEFAGVSALDTAVEKLCAAGHSVEVAEPSLAKARFVSGLVHVTDPAGNRLELYHGRQYDYQRFVSPVGVAGFVTGEMGLGHVVLPAPQLEKSFSFYTELLGFELTDQMHFRFNDKPNDPGHGLYFLHCHNPRHHTLALYQDNSPNGLVHMMVEVLNVDEVGRAFDRSQEHQIPISATLGRHTNDRMLSFYMKSPSGFDVELGCEGWQVDWSDYVPTTSHLPSFWGHKFNPPENG